MKKKVISMFLTACTVSVMVVGGGSNLVMADDAETVTLMGWYDEDDMNPILEKVNEQMDGKYVIEYTYVANTEMCIRDRCIVSPSAFGCYFKSPALCAYFKIIRNRMG